MLKLSRQTGNIKLTGLELWQPTFQQLCRAFSTPKIDNDKLNAGYHLRGAGTKRGNETVDDTAYLWILDGDSQIDTSTGEIINGAVHPWEVHLVLNHLSIDHFIYTSHSHNWGLNKYRVLIPVTYTRQQLPALLDWIFDRLHENGIMLTNVKENSSWAQAWFMPCVHPDRQHLFKTFWRVDGKSSNPLRDDTEIEFLRAEPFDVARIVADYENKKPKLIPTPERLTMPKSAIVTAVNPIQAFNASFSVHDVLIRNGYKQQGKRYLHPNSASKIAGVRILERGAFSDSNDVLNDGRCHDAFDCYRLIECGGDMKQALNWNSDITRANQRAFYEVPETKNPRDIAIGAGSITGVKLTSNESFRHSQFANSID